MKKVKKGLYYLGAIDANYEGYSLGEEWNSWECPYFSRETSEKILLEIVKVEDRKLSIWDEEMDRFILIGIEYEEDVDILLKQSTSDLIHEYNAEVFDKKDIQFDKKDIVVYQIGANSWVWSEDKTK